MNRLKRLIGLSVIFCVAAGLASCKQQEVKVASEPFLPLLDVRASNIAIYSGVVYAATGSAGLALIAPKTRQVLKRIVPPEPSGSVDELAIADGLMFVIDASSPGFLSVYSLADPQNPVLASGPISVPVGPFTGVSAANGLVVVSGGTSELTVRSYSADGKLGQSVSQADLARGQPDVLIDPNERIAFVSTHFQGDDYGLTVISLDTPPAAVTTLSTLLLDGAGSTSGETKPANFPIESALLGTRLLMAHGAGLAVVDISDPSNVRLQTVVDLNLAGINVALFGNLAYVVGCSPEPAIVVVDFEDPASPQVHKTIALPSKGRPTSVAVDQDTIAVATNSGGVIILNRLTGAP